MRNTGAMAKKKVVHVADKGGFLTLDEVEAWVRDARRSGADGGSAVDARVSFSGRIQKISVEVETAHMLQDEVR